jgi:hypothetical protein
VNDTLTIRCDRCGRPAELQLSRGVYWLPEGWSGAVGRPASGGPPQTGDAVCPGCQYAEWHPHCTATRVESGHGARVDIAALKRGEPVTVEIDGAPVVFRSFADLEALEAGEPGALGWCDYLDLTVSWTDDTEPPSEWRCPECGSTEFEGVHRDYQASNLKGTTFTAEIEPDDDSE